MKRILLVLLTLILMAVGVSATPVLDQSQPVIDGATIGAYDVKSVVALAQVFTQGITGSLTEVRLPISCGPLRVEIQGVTAGKPNGVVLSSQVFPSVTPSGSLFSTFASLPLASPPFLTAGTQYAVVFQNATATGECFGANGPAGNPYTGGDAYFAGFSGPTLVWNTPIGSTGFFNSCTTCSAPGLTFCTTCPRFDLPFMTFVEPGAPPAVCGNGQLEGIEACDDGNTFNGDGCSSACNVEPGFTCSGSPSVCTPTQVCGNGIREGTEQCDGTDFNTATCSTATGGTQPFGTLGCTGSCTFDTTNCFADGDGDGIPDPQDQCPGSTVDSIALNPNQYAQNLNFGAFEVGPNNDQSIVYSMQTTHGCTCKQIVAVLGVGAGHIKKGCSPSVMEQFTGVSANPDRQAGVGRQITGSAVSEVGSATAWLGLISVVSVIALAVVSLTAFNKLSKRR